MEVHSSNLGSQLTEAGGSETESHPQLIEAQLDLSGVWGAGDPCDMLVLVPCSPSSAHEEGYVSLSICWAKE